MHVPVGAKVLTGTHFQGRDQSVCFSAAVSRMGGIQIQERDQCAQQECDDKS